MKIHLQKEIDHLKKQLFHLSSLVEENLKLAISSVDRTTDVNSPWAPVGLSSTQGNGNPRTIIRVHGISAKREFDLLFGFGEDYEAIGGKTQAFKFKNRFNE